MVILRTDLDFLYNHLNALLSRMTQILLKIQYVCYLNFTLAPQCAHCNMYVTK